MGRAKKEAASGSKTGTVTKLADVAKAFGVAYQTAKQWSRGGMPGSPGKYDLAKIAEWKAGRAGDPERLAAAKAEQQALPAAPVSRRIEEARARKLEAQAAKAEREERLAAARIVHIEAVERFLSEFFTELAAQLGRIPEELKPSFPESVRQELADQLGRRLGLALATMQSWGQRLAARST